MRALRQTILQNVAEIDEMVCCEARVKRHSVKLGEFRNAAMQINDEAGLLDGRVVFERKNLSRLFGDKEAVHDGRMSHVHRLFELELRKDAFRHVWQGRIRRTNQP